MQSVNLHVVPAACFSSEGGLLTVLRCSRVGSFLWETILCWHLQGEPYPQAAGLQELFGSLPWRRSFRNGLLQHQSPTGSQIPPADLLQHGLFSMGPQVPARSFLQCRLPIGSSLLWASPCCGVESSTGCRWICVPPWTYMDCRGTAASPSSSLWAAGKSLLKHLNHLFPFLLH